MLSNKRPRHIAITMSGHLSYSRRNKIPIDKLYYRVFYKINEIVDFQVSNNVPIVTLNLLTTKAKNYENFPNIVDALVDFFSKLKDNRIVSDNKVKITILGKWYDLPGRLVEAIKEVIDGTKDYDSYFLNLCVNYDGQEEIVDACRMMARRIQAGKIDPEAIMKESVKDTIYSSYFLPPDIIIKTGYSRSLKGFLLWDSINSHIHFTGRSWIELRREDIQRAVDEWSVSGQ